MFITELFTIAKIWKQPVSISRWVDKNAVAHLHNGILTDYKTEAHPTFVTAWMELESIIVSEISKLEKDKYLMISLICGIQWTK